MQLQKTAQYIIKNREKNKNEINKIYLEDYLYKIVGVNNVEFRSILRDYADEVKRQIIEDKKKNLNVKNK